MSTDGDNVRERISSLEAICVLTRECYNKSLESLNTKMDKLIGIVQNDIKHTKERVFAIEKERAEEKGGSKIINNWIKPVVIGLVVAVCISIINVVFI